MHFSLDVVDVINIVINAPRRLWLDRGRFLGSLVLMLEKKKQLFFFIQVGLYAARQSFRVRKKNAVFIGTGLAQGKRYLYRYLEHTV